MARPTALASLFGRSPFKPMQEHISVVHECAGEVPALFEALCAGDQAGVVAAKERIFELEERADEIKNQLRAHLPRSLLLPVDRRDLLEVPGSAGFDRRHRAGHRRTLDRAANGGSRRLQGLADGPDPALCRCLCAVGPDHQRIGRACGDRVSRPRVGSGLGDDRRTEQDRERHGRDGNATGPPVVRAGGSIESGLGDVLVPADSMDRRSRGLRREGSNRLRLLMAR